MVTRRRVCSVTVRTMTAPPTSVARPGFSPMGMSPGTYGHGGRYGTFYFIDPAKDLIGIFMIHREGGSDERTAFVQMAYAALLE